MGLYHVAWYSPCSLQMTNHHKKQYYYKPITRNYHSMNSSQPVGEDKYAIVHRLKEFLYSLLHALPINSIHKPLLSNKFAVQREIAQLSFAIGRLAL